MAGRTRSLRERAADWDWRMANRAYEGARGQELMGRMRAGAYGLCTDCGKSIAAARLAAQPDAIRCLGCQVDYEKQASKR